MTRPTSPLPLLPSSRATLHRAIAASAVGNATEWFDYGIYAYGVAYISGALFPGTTAQATLFALATSGRPGRRVQAMRRPPPGWSLPGTSKPPRFLE